MSEIMLVRRNEIELTDTQKEALRIVLFGGSIDGLSDDDRKSWRNFWKRILKLEVGEIFSIDTWAPRIGKFHRLHMVIETSVFRAQERITSFEQFRYWLKIGSGFVDWMAGPKGGVVPVPRSISYKKCDEDTMRKFHSDVIQFFRTEHAQHYLWPHLSGHDAAEMMETILSEFER